MSEGKEEIHKNKQCEVSMAVCMGSTTNQRKVPKLLPFKNYKSESLNILCAYMGDICAYVYQIGARRRCAQMIPTPTSRTTDKA